MAKQVSMTVLVIDDDAHIRSSIGKFLIARGHTVIEAANGEKGVEVVPGCRYRDYRCEDARYGWV